MTFKVGDKVRVNSGHYKLGGLVGEIVQPHFPRFSGAEYPLVQFRGRTDLNKDMGMVGDKWYLSATNLSLVTKVPSIADDLRLKPQAKTVLRHLKAAKSITPMKAMVVYGIARLAASIFELRSVGYNVTKTMERDESGKHYASYKLLAN